MNRNLLFHFRPRRVPAQALPLTLTWGLGGTAALMVMIQIGTGLLLGFVYQPVPVQAYLSVQHIQQSIPGGQLIRNLHHWTGHILVIVIFLHMLRVFSYKALYSSRKGNWLVGLGLGLVVLLANFSGYLLPWDQLSFWAVTIAAAMLGYFPVIGQSLQQVIQGGTEVGAATLQLFYNVHTLLVPALLLVLMAYHFWFVRRAGGVLIPGGRQQSEIKDNMVPFAPELLVRECSASAVVICLLLLVSMFFNAPLGDMANPDLTPETVRAPWYFAGLQELLLHVPPILAVCVLPMTALLFLAALPFTGKENTGAPPLLTLVFILLIGSLTGLTLFAVLFRGPAMQLVLPW